ncbi:uncharacterized protein LY89DRAFT_710700 [Mollisia scopiformis]|uniref:Piwi domain-containing protein n=1 Tax=Mollisia scopiformis TaxID=149040 RepID=A0A132BD79_MOLSC|nr:uncharacterized protein LY89DRAFT_710700 [Mollisia scopiformis]KUJ10382.1 hypothetical protein LY89DRAFT_710700 [Mollisia scopiformis]
MFVGADCTHPRQSAKSCPSIAAIVATTDDTSSQYLGSARLQPSRQEYISDLRSMMTEKIRAWYLKTADEEKPGTKTERRLPSTIFFYRDGVSESQYGMVLHEELQQIRLGCKDWYDKVKDHKANNFSSNFKWKYIKIVFFVVIKRHHARFSPQITTSRDIVTPNHVNFYLQSHASPKSMAKSSHYVVLQNNSPKDYTLKQLEDISHHLCCVGPHLLCGRLRCYMKPALDNKYPLDENARSKHDYENDEKISHNDPEKIRKSPWKASLDNVMFYL